MSVNASQGNWTKTEAYPGYVMLSTTSAVDALPMMKSEFTFKPCMHPGSEETYPANEFYSLERQQKERCEMEPNSRATYDPRFYFTGYEVQEITLLSEKGIWFEL